MRKGDRTGQGKGKCNVEKMREMLLIVFGKRTRAWAKQREARYYQVMILYRAPRTGGTILTAGDMCWQKNLSQSHLSTTDLIRSSLRSKPGVCDESTQNNLLNHCRHFVTLFHVSFDITNSLGPFFNPIKPTVTDISHGTILFYYIAQDIIVTKLAHFFSIY